MSSFGARRQARVISVDEEEAPGARSADGDQESAGPLFNSKLDRKPFRQSGLRKSIVSDDHNDTQDEEAQRGIAEEEEAGPAVVRPKANRGAFGRRKATKSSQLSFGGDDGNMEDEETTPVAKISRRAKESSALRRSVGTKGLPLRAFGDDDERPKYSKEYLQELQSSTPNTPVNLESVSTDPDEMILDASELDGATVVDIPHRSIGQSETSVLSAAEIQERKERRARLAKEENFLDVDDDGSDEYAFRKKKDDGRLVAEDEELGEGFDNFVDDGGLSLGKKAIKERSKREKQHMAELITEAEGHSSDGSSASEAEQRIAYEAAQTRAGMDGLKKPMKTARDEMLQIPPKITPLPSLSECLARLQASLDSTKDSLKAKQRKVAELKMEEEEISKREQELQALLDEAGKKYRKVMGSQADEATISNGPGAELAGERGLESIGTTPQRPEEDSVYYYDTAK